MYEKILRPDTHTPLSGMKKRFNKLRDDVCEVFQGLCFAQDQRRFVEVGRYAHIDRVQQQFILMHISGRSEYVTKHASMFIYLGCEAVGGT